MNGFYSLQVFEYKIFVLNSNLMIVEDSKAEKMLNWLDEELALLINQKSIILTHYPPINSFFNGGEQMWTNENVKNFKKIMNKHQNIKMIFAGHLHKGVFGQISKIPVIVNPSVSLIYNTKPSFRLYSITEKNFE